MTAPDTELCPLLAVASLAIDAGSDVASDIEVGGEWPTWVRAGAFQCACIWAVQKAADRQNRQHRRSNESSNHANHLVAIDASLAPCLDDVKLGSARRLGLRRGSRASCLRPGASPRACLQLASGQAGSLRRLEPGHVSVREQQQPVWNALGGAARWPKRPCQPCESALALTA